jgi:hypothetical protein
MVVEPLKPKRGGFLRPFGCGEFIRDFLVGNGPYGSPSIDPDVGAPQADIFHYYKMALITATALDRATRTEERRARLQRRPINPDNIDRLAEKYQAHMPYKGHGCRYHSFITYFANLQRLRWVEPTGLIETSAFQERYPPGQPRRYYRLTAAGLHAQEGAWSNPYLALYGSKPGK